MKRLVILLLFQFSIFNIQLIQAQWWTGWSEQTSLALCLHLDGDSLELYSPLQHTDPIPISQWSLQNDTLRIHCKSIGFKATLVRQDSLWQGNWRQGILREQITFHPADTLYRLRRPQTPQPPYRFDEETIVADYVDSHGDSIHLEGTLTYPKQSNSSPKLKEGGRRSTAVEECGKYPTIVLVSGSGQQNRDSEILFHKPFLVLADYLASRGIATLRYDDRGVGASTGPLDSADTRTLSEDAEAMLRAVRNNEHVDATRLGIGGHSEGGAIAPMVAARNKEAKFVVMLAGMGCTGLDILLQQNDAIYRAKGVSGRLCQVRVACMRDLFALPQGSTVKGYQAVILRHTEGLTPTEVDSIDLKKGVAYAMRQQVESAWMQAFLRLDPADYLPQVTVPILALQGTKDCQVIAAPNIAGITRLAGNHTQHVILSNLNHLFQHCTTGALDEYVRIEETFAPEAMEKIANFILGIK